MKSITYTTALKLLEDIKEWLLEGEDIFVPQFLLSQGLSIATFDIIKERYPELAPRIEEIAQLDESKIVGFMAKGVLSKNVGEFILNRYYPPQVATNTSADIVVRLEY